jgi:hypothetical protein
MGIRPYCRWMIVPLTLQHTLGNDVIKPMPPVSISRMGVRAASSPLPDLGSSRNLVQGTEHQGYLLITRI